MSLAESSTSVPDGAPEQFIPPHPDTHVELIEEFHKSISYDGVFGDLDVQTSPVWPCGTSSSCHWREIGEPLLHRACEQGRADVVFAILRSAPLSKVWPQLLHDRALMLARKDYILHRPGTPLEERELQEMYKPRQEAAEGESVAAVVALQEDDLANADHFDLPLFIATKAGHPAVVQVLVHASADVNYAPRPDGKTALLHAAAGLQVDVLQILVELGANVHKQGAHNGWTAHDYAERFGGQDQVKIDCVKGMLVKFGLPLPPPREPPRVRTPTLEKIAAKAPTGERMATPERLQEINREMAEAMQSRDMTRYRELIAERDARK